MKCRFTDIICIGAQDLRAQKKKNRISFLLVFLSLVIYIGVNSTIESMQRNTNDILEKPEGRLLVLPEPEGENSYSTLLKERYADDERIENIFVSVPIREVTWENCSEILYQDEEEVNLRFAYDQMLDYISKGEKRIPEKNEIIIPKYLYNMGVYDQYTYADGDELIGKKITLTYTSSIEEYTKTYEFEVIATYDNVRMCENGDLFFANVEIGLEVEQLCYEEALERYNENIKYMVGEIEPAEEVIQHNVRTFVYVSLGYDVEEVRNQIYDESGIMMSVNRRVSQDIIFYYNYVAVVGNVIAVSLLMVAVINIIISSISEVSRRKWEFALKISMGYRRSDIIKIFFVEKFLNLLKALALALFVIAAYSLVATYAMQNLLEFWKRAYTIMISPMNVMVSILLIFMASLIGVIVGRISINKINVVKELKAKD